MPLPPRAPFASALRAPALSPSTTGSRASQACSATPSDWQAFILPAPPPPRALSRLPNQNGSFSRLACGFPPGGLLYMLARLPLLREPSSTGTVSDCSLTFSSACRAPPLPASPTIVSYNIDSWCCICVFQMHTQTTSLPDDI